MKNLKLYTLVMVVFLLLGSCKVRQPTVITNTIHDTIHIEKVERIREPIKTTIVITDPCDSIGILKDFKRTLKTSTAEVIVSNEEGDISVEVNLDSIKQVWEKEFKGEQSFTIKEIPVDKPVLFIPKWVWYISGTTLLYIVYRVLRIYIPILKILPY